MTRITLAEVQEKFNDVNTRESYVIDKEKGLMILFHPLFSEVRIEKLRQELIEKLQFCNKNSIDFLKTDAELYSYMHFLIIRYFTHLEDEISGDFQEQLVQFHQLYETGLMKLIITEVLPQEQIQRVYDEVLSFVEAAQQAMALEEKVKNFERAKTAKTPKKPASKKKPAPRKKPSTKEVKSE